MREHWMENKTEQNCLISVIVPVYNILDCLERCVNSVCAQTWKILRSCWWMTDQRTEPEGFVTCLLKR